MNWIEKLVVNDYDFCLKLKKAGFNEPCIAAYIHGIVQTQLKSRNSRPPGRKLGRRDEIEYCTCPTWQQAFDWFRKIGYDTSILRTPPEMVGKGRIKKYSYFIWKEDDNPRGSQAFEDTYEEAREKCLKKLIEICKNN